MGKYDADKLAGVRDEAREMAVQMAALTRVVAVLARLRGVDPGRVDALVALRDCHAGRVSALAGRLRHAMCAIDAVPDSRARAILTMYYIEDMSIEAIAEVLDLDPRHVRRLRKQALAMVGQEGGVC